MSDPNRIILPITPRSWITFRSGPGGNASLFFIPLECRSRHRVTGKEEDAGKPCDQYLSGDIYCGHFNDKKKWVGHTLSKKGRQNKANIEKYNDYRTNLFHLAKKNKVQLQAAGMAIYYHFPVPLRWTKKKKAAMHGQLKMSKSDCTNLQKAVEDALTGQDENIAQYSGSGKFWFLPELVAPKLRQGYVEILFNQPLYNPYGVELQNPYTLIEMEDITSRRAKLKKRKEELAAERDAEAQKKKPKHKPKPLKILDEKKLFKKEDRIK